MFGLFKGRKKKDPDSVYKIVAPRRLSLEQKAATRFSSFMTKKEEGTSLKSRKVVLIIFCSVMLLLLWLPLFFRQKPRVVHSGHIIHPIDLSREDYRLQNQYLDSAIVKANKIRQKRETGKFSTAPDTALRTSLGVSTLPAKRN